MRTSNNERKSVISLFVIITFAVLVISNTIILLFKNSIVFENKGQSFIDINTMIEKDCNDRKNTLLYVNNKTNKDSFCDD